MKNFKPFPSLPKLFALCLLSIRVSVFTEEPAKVSFQFSVFPLESGEWRGIHYAPTGDPKEDSRELRFNQRERSPAYTYEGPLPLRLYRWVVNEEGDRVPQIVGIVSPPEDAEGHPLIFFMEPPEENGLLRISTMVDSDENFPNESIVFFNTLNVSFLGILGETEMVLPPGKSSAISVRDYLETEVPIALAIRHNDDLHLVANNRIRFFQDRRTLMILRPPRRPGSIRIRTQRLTEYTGKRGEDLPEETPPEGTF